MASALSSCVSSLQSTNQLLSSSISILDSGVSDFPRLSKVLQTTRVRLPSFTLVFYPDHPTAQYYRTDSNSSTSNSSPNHPSNPPNDPCLTPLRPKSTPSSPAANRISTASNVENKRSSRVANCSRAGYPRVGKMGEGVGLRHWQGRVLAERQVMGRVSGRC